MNLIYKKNTFGVSYTGKVSYGSCDRHIAGFFSEPETKDAGIFIEITVADGYIMLAFAQEWESDIYLNAFCRQLEENDLHYEIIEKDFENVPGMSLPSQRVK